MPEITTNPVVCAIRTGEEFLAAKAALDNLMTPALMLFVEQVDNGDILVTPYAKSIDMDANKLQYHLVAWRLMMLDGLTSAGECLTLAVAAYNQKGFGYAKARDLILKGNHATREAAMSAVRDAMHGVTVEQAKAEAEAENVANGHKPSKPKAGRPPKPANDQIGAVLDKVSTEGGTLTAEQADAIIARIRGMVK